MNMVLKPEEFLMNPAFELKESIHANTMKGFISTMLLIVLVSVGILVFPKNPTIPVSSDFFEKGQTQIEVGPDVTIKVNNIPIKPASSNTQSVYTGIKEVAGDLRIVSDDTPESELPTFASITTIAIALSQEGDGIRKNINSIQSEIKPIEKSVKPIDLEDHSTFISAEIDPSFDLAELQKNIAYPEMARKIGLEGSVTVRVIIDENGGIISTGIMKSDNEVFNKSAIDAIRKTNFSPAIQNGKRIKCPIVIPIKFRLR